MGKLERVSAQADRYTVGIDFGTESGRALLVRVSDGAELACAIHAYAGGVIDNALPGGGPRLPPGWALQDPEDYLETVRRTVPSVLEQSGVPPERVIGIGIDFTSSTMLPTTEDATPLCRLPEFRNETHAWPKLWKHHGAQAQAERMTELALSRGEEWLKDYGGKVSSEWFFSKALQILEESPGVYRAAARLIEAGDWLLWQLTGSERRGASAAGYKAFRQDGRFPDASFFAQLHPDFAGVVGEKMCTKLEPVAARAGVLGEQGASWTGLRPGTPVATANIDAHATVPATGYVEPGTLVLIMGTSTCHILLASEKRAVEGMCGVVAGGVVPGLYGYESGQSAVGDMFAWFVDGFVPGRYSELAREAGQELHAYLAERAASQAPGANGLLALDWHNGNRSVLVDAELSGMLVGLTLASDAVDIYRALMEATVYGSRMIIEAYQRGGLAIDRLVVAGGLPGRNPHLVQMCADVFGREIQVIRSSQGAALGSAICAAVAAGAYGDVATAARAMGGVEEGTYRPRSEWTAAYDEIYQDYLAMHDLLGRSARDEQAGVMKRLHQRRMHERGGRTGQA